MENITKLEKQLKAAVRKHDWAKAGELARAIEKIEFGDVLPIFTK